MKLKIIKIIFLSALCAVSRQVLAYDLKIENGTPFKATVHVRYKGESLIACRPDNKDVDPGRTLEVSTGLCLVGEIWADVHEERTATTQVYGVLKAGVKRSSSYKSSGTAFNHFHLYGPLITLKPGQDKTINGLSEYDSKYGVSRTLLQNTE